MIAELSVPYIDVSAGDLTFATDAPDIEILDELVVANDAGVHLSLRLLGASHQTVMTLPTGSTMAETVAYRPGLPARLPAQHTQSKDGWAHRFSCETQVLTPEEFSEFSQRTHYRARDNPLLLIGVFGNEPDAFTALEVTTLRPLSWHTFHTYPQYGQVVATASHLTSTRSSS